MSAAVPSICHLDGAVHHVSLKGRGLCFHVLARTRGLSVWAQLSLLFWTEALSLPSELLVLLSFDLCSLKSTSVLTALQVQNGLHLGSAGRVLTFSKEPLHFVLRSSFN